MDGADAVHELWPDGGGCVNVTLQTIDLVDDILLVNNVSIVAA